MTPNVRKWPAIFACAAFWIIAAILVSKFGAPDKDRATAIKSAAQELCAFTGCEDAATIEAIITAHLDGKQFESLPEPQ